MNNAEEFLQQKQLFQLGVLPTETPNPKTSQLSRFAESDIPAGLRVLKSIDVEVLSQLQQDFNKLDDLFSAVVQTIRAGRRIFLVGCGATGRLSLSLEYLWRCRHPASTQVCSLMAGGDVALVHSLEGFEDFPQYGARHLSELGFTADDLLIGTTEGGETPYVIGAVEHAAKVSTASPFFLFCNPPDILRQKVERSRRVLDNPKIRSSHLATGPMALTGSTRMQASTVLMLAVGMALEYLGDPGTAQTELGKWIEFIKATTIEPLAELVQREADIYSRGEHTVYLAEELAMTVFTDTTERAPTFNLAPFDNPKHLTDRHSLTYLAIPSTVDAASAWHRLLARPPRPLAWPEIHSKTSADYLLSFDFSRQAVEFRKNVIPGAHHTFAISLQDKHILFALQELELRWPAPASPLFAHLTVKMLLNMHSTLVMGRLKRFEGNLMTWVYPSNGKLVDRAARYTQILLHNMGKDLFSYDDIVRAQFKAKARLSPKESIVHKTIEILFEPSLHQNP